jgi:hypothetical protein
VQVLEVIGKKGHFKVWAGNPHIHKPLGSRCNLRRKALCSFTQRERSQTAWTEGQERNPTRAPGGEDPSLAQTLFLPLFVLFYGSPFLGSKKPPPERTCVKITVRSPPIRAHGGGNGPPTFASLARLRGAGGFNTRIRWCEGLIKGALAENKEDLLFLPVFHYQIA